MLISLPIAYPATVVRAGRRKEEPCMLALELPVRIPDAPPRLAARVSPDHAAMLARARNSAELTHMMSRAPDVSWFTDGRSILSDLRLPGTSPGGPPVPAEDFAAFVRSTVGIPAGVGMFSPGNHPFQADEAAYGPVYRESDPFTVLRVAPGKREAAIAFAVRLAARCAGRPDGTVAVPCRVPKLDVFYGRVHLRVGPPPLHTDAVRSFRLDEWNLALAMAAEWPHPPETPPVRIDVRWLPESRADLAAQALDLLCLDICSRDYLTKGPSCMQALAEELRPLMADPPGPPGVAPDRLGEAADVLEARVGAVLALERPAWEASGLMELAGMMSATLARWRAAAPEAAPRTPRGP